MSEEELIAILKDLYENAATNEQVASIHLFGIQYANELRGKNLKDIARKATGKESYFSEINKGIRLKNLLQNNRLLNVEHESKTEFIKRKIQNIILYGPPGVGKTHNYQHLISMIENGDDEKEMFDTITDNQTSEKTQLGGAVYQKIKDEKRVKFVTFHQSYSYEDFIEGFRPNEKGTIALEDGIFKRVAKEALENQKASKNSLMSFSDAYEEMRSKYLEGTLEQLHTVRGINIIINEFSERFIKVISEGAKNEQYIKKSDLEIVVDAILDTKVAKPADIKRLNVKKDTVSLAGYYFPIANKITSIMQEKQVTVEQKNYYIIIDEINRGNISKIFGELITLIEEDKRDMYEVTLPYSKEPFKIPSNLYIIATMNSTDKSIATIDIALRRRFTFLKMKPNSALVDNQEARTLMERLNEFIKEKLGEDFMLGHSYFMDNNMDIAFLKEYKIKPLLEEYFYSDEDFKADKLLDESLT
jgi:5-methylcytosine-specific restriction protein B